ncbi:F166A protein, partial [Dasyornis broadbenti]|nr:F166A protein [Dasyornis broadbenti]
SYGGYVPQFTFRFGNTYGKTTHDVLTDPCVSKSPRSVLAPLDNMPNLLRLHYQIDH